LHTFAATLPFPGPYTNSEGAVPHAGLILSGSTLYGTTSRGGSSGYGILFAVNTDGTGFTNLHTFVATDGAGPRDLILSSNTLYGTTASGGSLGGGVAFAVNIDGNGFTNLHSFTTISAPYYTNSDGHFPSPRLVLSGDTLYGTTHLGGSFANGAIFSVHTDGTGFTNLHNFTVTVSGINYDGIKPLTGLIISGDTLYGTTEEGGRNGVNGTVFAVNTDGSGFTNLHSFSPTFGAFGTNSDGAKPRGELILSGNTLYGTTQYGGVFGSGTIFSISLPPPPPPQLTIIRSAENIVLSWPTNSTGFTLQSTTNLPSTNWSPVPDAPAIVGNRFYVTNSPAGSALFYRLRGN